MELIIKPTEDPKKYSYTLAYIISKKRDERNYTLIVVDPEKGLFDLDENNGIASISLVSGGEGYDFSRLPSIRIIDLGEGAIFNTTPAMVTAKIGTGKGLPPRVAKFVVSSIDAIGTITSLQIIPILLSSVAFLI